MRIFLVLFCLISALTLGACQKEEVAQQENKLQLPTTELDEDWKRYVQEIAKSKFVRGKTKGPYVRFLGITEDPSAHLRDTVQSFQRGVAPGSLLVYGSYNSRNMANLLEEALKTEYIDGKLTGVRLVFVGRNEDRARVEAAAVKSGVSLEFQAID